VNIIYIFVLLSYYHGVKMRSAAAVTERYLTELFEQLYSAINTEEIRTQQECKAFRAFSDQIQSLQPGNHSSSTAVASHPHIRRFPSSADDYQTAVQQAYEDTIMDLSFYETEYGESYLESLSEEFGTEVATAVSSPHCFTHAAKQALLCRIAEALSKRENLLETLSDERHSIATSESELTSLISQIDHIEATMGTSSDHRTRDGYQQRLSVLSDQCESVAHNRQGVIQSQRETYCDEPSDPDLTAYLYQSVEPTYPVLSLCSSLASQIDTLRSELSS
jgi:hypothetical protein